MTPIGWKPLLVKCMPSLVQNRHQRVENILFVVARGYTRVIGHPTTERMMAHVQAPAIEIEAERAHHHLPERVLPLGRDRARDGQRCLLVLEHALQQLRKEGLEVIEDLRHPRRTSIGLVAIEQRIVGRKRKTLSKCIGLFDGQANHLLEKPADRGPITVPTRDAPRLLTPGTCDPLCSHQRLRHGGRTPLRAAHGPHVGPLPRIQLPVAALGLNEQGPDLRMGEPLM